jgi:hypothetical protein
MVVEVVRSSDETVERASWPPAGASRGEARTWADWTGFCSAVLMAELSGIPEIPMGVKVGMCWAALVDHGRICSRNVLAC